jgi:hypothetical protein
MDRSDGYDDVCLPKWCIDAAEGKGILKPKPVGATEGRL